jgi:alkanesulfonate monooxygenase SsuD/methylene tetrahydromethanopterin reductase-like flavin-dependent oxidoreductase (luciferase family)
MFIAGQVPGADRMRPRHATNPARTDEPRLSEAAKHDFIFLADSPAAAVGAPAALSRLPHKMTRFELVSLLSAFAVSTSRIGLAVTLSTSYYEPFNVARLFGSLDHLSGGRACWNVVTSDHDETGYNYGFDGLSPHGERYERAEEFVDVCFGCRCSLKGSCLEFCATFRCEGAAYGLVEAQHLHGRPLHVSSSSIG